MTEKVSRQQRRQQAREEVKKQYTNPTPAQNQNSTSITVEQYQGIVQDLQKLYNYTKVVDNHVWMIVETLARKNIIQWNDVNETEQLYKQREIKRRDRIKELLSEDKTTLEYLEAVIEDPYLPGYEKLNINPVKDLNLNPFEVGAIIKEQNPDLEESDYLRMGKEWGITSEHFGYKKEEQK